MGRLESRLTRLWYAEYPRSMIWASRHIVRRTCLDWLAMLEGRAPATPTAQDHQAAQLLVDWGQQHNRVEQAQPDQGDLDPLGGLAHMRCWLATSSVAEADRLLALLRRWERDQHAAARDPESEFARLRERLYEFYKTETWEGV